MPADPKPRVPDVGELTFEVYGAGRHGRQRASRFRLRCDAVALHDNQMLLLSAAGPETSVKALTAGLRASGQDQKRIDYSVRLGELWNTTLLRCPEGYRIHRVRLEYGLWHVLCLSQREGFLPALSEESLWQMLQADRFTTPLLRAWMPWLLHAMKERNLVVALTQHGCQAGVLTADTEVLDALVREGILGGHLAIGGQKARGQRGQRGRRSKPAAVEEVPGDLDDYLLRHGSLLGKQAQERLEPLHVPGRDPLPALALLRAPFEAQAHVIAAACQALRRQKALLLVGEMGTGKTLMSMAALHAHAAGRPYRALVFCPGQLVHKWAREIRATLPGVRVVLIESWKDLLPLERRCKPKGVEWFVIARDRAKLGPRWQPAVTRRRHADDGFLRCPDCGRRLVNDQGEPLLLGQPAHQGQPGTGLCKKRSKCTWVLTQAGTPEEPGEQLVPGCGAALWRMNREIWRYEPALFIKRHLRHFFRDLILDEVHEEKGSDTAQGHAAAALAASCRKVMALTGTLIGGYAEHLRPLLFRLSPRSLVQEGLSWPDAMAFNERYGRIETRITQRDGRVGEDHRMSRGSKSTTRSLRPGIMPLLFGRHLLDKAVFLGLSEVAGNLPPLAEECISVIMDPELAAAYRQDVEKPLVEAIRAMMQRRDRRLLGAMLQTLLAYPDYPFGWGAIGYQDGGQFVTVARPPDLPGEIVRAKEAALLELVRSERAQGRKVWVFVQYTDRHDVQSRLARLLSQAGLRTAVLHASVPLDRREAWIARHAPELDVVISHPRLVETGLDLFDQGGRYNFPTLCFYETGYNLFTLRQASRRSWRIGQSQPCRVVYLHYQGTMQDRALALMGRKLTAAQALEGQFSSEGLVALAGEDASGEMALARSLVERLDEGEPRRFWNKVCNAPGENRPRPLPITATITAEPVTDEFDLTFWMEHRQPLAAVSPRKSSGRPSKARESPSEHRPS